MNQAIITTVSDPPNTKLPGSGGQTPLVELREITRTFKAVHLETIALAGVSLTIGSGEWLAITGPSGSGKSTLLATLGLLEAPTTGRSFFQGTETTTLSEAARTRLRRGRIAYVFQAIHLAAHLSVADNIDLALRGLNLTHDERTRRINDSLEAVDLAGRRSHRPAELSGGQQQRVAIARALAARPRLLLADEPTGNLDSKTGQRILELLARLHRAGTTVVLVTHEPRIASNAHRTIEMLDGRIVAERNEPGHR